MATAIVKRDFSTGYDFSKLGTSLLYEADGVTPASQSFDSIRMRIQAALDAARNSGVDLDLDGDNDAGYNGDCCWVMDVFPATVVYSMGGELFQCDYSDDGETVTLGTPVEVERSYTMVSNESGPREVFRAFATEYEQLKESGYDASKGVLTITVIKPGFSKNSSKLKESGKTLPRYYPAATLKRDHKKFDGSKMFIDHQTEAEAKARPEGSVRDWVGTMGETWVESDGTVMAPVTIIDPQFKAKLDRLNVTGMLKEMKTSVRIAATVNEGSAEGKDAAVIESIVSNKSVDFVTYAGAGGQVEAMESQSEADLDLVSLEELSERRPDLVELIESRARKETTDVKTLEQQLQEANAKVGALTTERDELKAKVEAKDNAPMSAKQQAAIVKENEELKQENSDLKTGQQKRDAATKLAQLLKESKLPEPAQKRLTERFKDATSTEDMEEAIKDERAYLKATGGKTEVRNLGEGHNPGDKVDHKANIVEGFIGMGLTKDQAEIAAAGRR